MKAIFKVFPLLGISLMLFSCAQGNQTSPGYDGREYDISVNKDKSLIAKSVKEGNYYNLTISGSGAAIDYTRKEEVPWNPIVKKIQNVDIEEGIENIGDYFFYSLPISHIFLPSTVMTVGDHSFSANTIIYTYGGPLSNVENVYYYSENKPTSKGNYFHFVDGEIEIWHVNPSFLFVGNSFTYKQGDVNNPSVPLYFKAIANSFGENVTVDWVVKGSHTLTGFADKNDEMGAILDAKLKENEYDFVILQEQSTTPLNSNADQFINAVKTIKEKVDNTQDNCEVVLYSTWGYPDKASSYGGSVASMEQRLTAAYEKAAKEANCRIHYIGKAFTYAYEHVDQTKYSIFADDNRHQSALGAYLSAACHIRSFFHLTVSGTTEYCDLNENGCKAMLGVADTVIN